MNDRSATTTKDTLFRATSIQPATLIRTFAVGLHQGQRTWFPRKQAGHMTATANPFKTSRKKRLPIRAVQIWHRGRRFVRFETARDIGVQGIVDQLSNELSPPFWAEVKWA